MDKEILDQITLKMGMISGLIFLVIITPLRIYWRNQALNKAKLSLENNEKILHLIKFSFAIDYIAPFCFAGFFGSYILPFWLFPNITRVDSVFRAELIYFIPAEILFFIVLLTLFNFAIVVTNCKIKRMSLFPILSNITKNANILLTDASSIYYSKFLFFDQIDIKNGEKTLFSLSGYKDLKEVKNLLDSLIKNTGV